MKVRLITYTPNPEQVVATAAKLCYSNSDIEGLMEKQTSEKTEKFVKMLSDMGHQSPIEHISFTFAVEGVSRSLTHQLVRHRIASYSQKSQRYVVEGNPDYVIPSEIAKDEKLTELYDSTMEKIWGVYGYIARTLQGQYLELGMDYNAAQKKAIENARYVLPNACCSSVIVTMNARSLLHFFSLRCCNRAQDEIRELADEMLKLVKEVAPNIFNHAGAPCMYGNCPEGKMSCGHPRKVEN